MQHFSIAAPGKADPVLLYMAFAKTADDGAKISRIDGKRVLEIAHCGAQHCGANTGIGVAACAVVCIGQETFKLTSRQCEGKRRAPLLSPSGQTGVASSADAARRRSPAALCTGAFVQPDCPNCGAKRYTLTWSSGS